MRKNCIICIKHTANNESHLSGSFTAILTDTQRARSRRTFTIQLFLTKEPSMSLTTDRQAETSSVRFPIRPSQLPIPTDGESETSAPQTMPTRAAVPLARHTGGGRHFSSVAPPELIASTDATRHQLNEAIEQMQRDNPLLTVPTKYHAKAWPLVPLVALLNYVIPTRYMRFFWGGVWFTMNVWLRGKSRRPPAPYLPQRSRRARTVRVSNVAQNVVLHEGKVISVFHFGGGVGKTTHSGRLALQIKKLRPDLVVDVLDCGEGTLVQRFVRNVRNSFLDFLDNLEQGKIEQPSDLARYRTVTPEGIYVTAWRRDSQISGVRNVTRQEILNGIRLFAEYSNVVVCDLPYGNGPTHRGVLDGTHQVQLVTIPAADRLDQAVASYGWLIENNYEHLARTAVIVVNRCKSYADLEKVRTKFYENYGAYMDQVRFQPVYFNKNLEKGGKLTLEKFSRNKSAQYAEYGAALLNELADGKRDDLDSVMTHLEVLSTHIKKELPQRSPRIGSPTPDGGPAQPAIESNAHKE